MSMKITGNYREYAVQSTRQVKEAEKPKWDSSKVYTYLEDYNAAGIRYGEEAARYYATVTEQDGKLTTDELKQQIREMFSEYTLTDSEPGTMRAGKHYLYIDESQLQKMADNPAYRAKVYGLMDREYTCCASYTLKYSDGRNVTAHVTGSFFSLSEENRQYVGADDVPYRGGCMTDQPWSSSESHCQVRNQSFLYDNLDPAKSAAKQRKLSAVKQEAKKRAEKAKEKKKAAKEDAEERLERAKEAAEERRVILDDGSATLELSEQALAAQDSISIHISEAGFEAMKNDSEYEEWVLDYIQADFMCYNPWASVCGGHYVVYNFGATKEECHAEGWYAGYQNGNGEKLYNEKSKNSFWERRIENKKRLEKQMEKREEQKRIHRVGTL